MQFLLHKLINNIYINKLNIGINIENENIWKHSHNCNFNFYLLYHNRQYINEKTPLNFPLNIKQAAIRAGGFLEFLFKVYTSSIRTD